MNIFLAGGSGMVGHHVAAQLLSSGHSVRALSRSGTPVPGCEMRCGDLLQADTLAGLCDGQDAVISCAGAVMQLGKWSDRHSFTEVDYRGNANLLREAERADVSKFVYVSLYAAERLLHTEYAQAHESFVSDLEGSKIRSTVVRPTGFFGFFRTIQEMAQKGRGVIVGKGTAQTNPIHEIDVAQACIEALTLDQAAMPIGGPTVYTREEIVRLAFESLDKSPSITHVAPTALRILTAPVKLINPRIKALMDFGLEVGLTDVVAPAYGRRTLEDFFFARRAFAHRTQLGAT